MLDGVGRQPRQAVDAAAARDEWRRRPAWFARQAGAGDRRVRGQRAEASVRGRTEQHDRRRADGGGDVREAAVVGDDHAGGRHQFGGVAQRDGPDEGSRMRPETASRFRRGAAGRRRCRRWPHPRKRAARSGKYGQRFAAIRPVLQPGAMTTVPRSTRSSSSRAPIGRRQIGPSVARVAERARELEVILLLVLREEPVRRPRDRSCGASARPAEPAPVERRNGGDDDVVLGEGACAGPGGWCARAGPRSTDEADRRSADSRHRARRRP